ncbi:MAG: GAF domain-containing sensor histidine kinase [Desulfobulbaceae bacterium]|nr:GAF domain-containing sensor histidine kinase [Desulfobulbaceae bacterium]
MVKNKKQPAGSPKPAACRSLTSDRLQDSIFKIAKSINSKRTNNKRQLNEILETILDYLGAEKGSIMLVEKKKYLEVKASTRKEIIGMRQPLKDDSVASWVAQNGKALFIPDIAKDKRFPVRGNKNYRKNSLLSVPILHKGKAIGVINVTDKAGAKELLPDDIACLLDFSSMLLWLVVQQNLNAELKKQRNTLRKRNKELHRQEELRAELSKTLLHDLKGPLAEVVANLDIISYSINDENREFLESAQIACDRAVRMASNLVSVDKIEDGKLKLIKEEINPMNLLEESLSSIKGLAKIKGVELIIKTPPEPPQALQMDRTMILRVMQNLLTNGLGYSDPGTSITIGCQLTNSKKKLEFFVQDQGPGIPEAQQETIFEKYARVSPHQDTLVGTGLGLYFCRLAVELHRGKIGLESNPGEGSRFFFALPIQN